MRSTLDRIVTAGFAVAMIGFLALACALVLTQLVGVATVQPVLVETADAWFKRPAIVAAVLVGILGFVLFMVRGEKPAES